MVFAQRRQPAPPPFTEDEMEEQRAISHAVPPASIMLEFSKADFDVIVATAGRRGQTVKGVVAEHIHRTLMPRLRRQHRQEGR